MTTFRFFTALLVLTVLAKTSQAQRVHLGMTTAVNATFVLDKGLSEDPRYSSTYTYNVAPIGFNFGLDLGTKFGISLESILSKQGQIYDIIDAAEQIKGERKIDLNYLQLPLLFRFMSGGDAAVRANFNLGPQLSILTEGVETMQYQAGTYKMPDDADFQLPEGAVDNGDGTYTTPAMPSTDILSSKADQFKKAEFQLAAAFGLDIDISKHLFLTTQIRANYSLTDMRNGDVIDAIKNGEASDIFGQRANMLVGIQLGVHYSFGITRSFIGKQ